MSEVLKQQLDRIADSTGEEVTAVLDTIAHDLRNSIATIRMECAVLAQMGNGSNDKIKAIAANMERAMDGVRDLVTVVEAFVERHDGGAG